MVLDTGWVFSVWENGSGSILDALLLGGDTDEEEVAPPGDKPRKEGNN
jgi:hypothetical protein